MSICNKGVQEAFKAIYGSSDLPPGMKGQANEMAQAWAQNPKYWQHISMSEAQDYANKGYFVVAGYINPKGHGHVVIIVPGKMSPSSKWKCAVPRTMDTGSNKRLSNTLLSNSFGKDKKSQIHYYYYKR